MISTGMHFKLICMIGITLIQPYPFLIGIRSEQFNASIQAHIYYHVNDFLQFFSYLRQVMAIIKLLNLSSWISNSSNRIW